MQRRLLQLAALALAMTLFVACGGTKRPSVDTPPAARADARQVVYTATLTVRVDEAEVAVPRASRIATDAGGFVFALKTGRSAHLTLKVPANRFDAVMDQLAGLGRALDRDVKARDVTEEVVDVDARLRSAEASVDRLRTLLAQAASTPDLVVVETELAKRQGELESLQGRLRVLRSQVDLATIDARLTEQAEPELARGVPGFGSALRAGMVALANAGVIAVAAVGFLLPFLPLIAIGVWLARRRRHRRRQTSVSSTLF